jgi:2-polyprenyl-3-methyl-5-hydroxy-6-metoxy-1,4-benzoquinol methylase
VTYRDTLYRSYFSTQSGVVGTSDLTARLAHEARQLGAEVAPWLPAGKDAAILEVGCGWGPFLHFARAAGYLDVRGIDTSPEQVARARELGLDHAEVADAFVHLDARPGAYDCILALDVVEHFSRAEAVRLLQAIHLALRPGGRVILRTPNADAPFASINVHGDLTHELALNAQSMTQLLLTCGFGEIELRGSDLGLPGRWKELLRRAAFPAVKLAAHVALFALGRSTRVLLSPQLLARAVRA